MKEIKDFLQYSSSTAIVAFEESLKDRSFWVIFTDEQSEEINNFILKHCNNPDVHLTKHCHCPECGKRRKKQKLEKCST